MIRDADATRARLLAAARAEFAAHGIAGARVDRIAAKAGSNKAQIYHYFTSKEGLFDAVFASIVEEVLREAPLDPDDLPGYAVKLAEGYERHPDILRLVTWQRLERGDQPPSEAAIAVTERKVSQIAQAQQEGRVSSRYPADILLTAILHTAAMWTSTSPESASAGQPPSAAARRRYIAQIVTDLISETPRT
ncbi:TetR family transcriptional regulator [Streptomyces misionensis]|uniref:TetR family transcriptional regulator n=1 Tax=Streptomyces misionensis TaxID=67331 RepID=UPI0033E66200